MADALAFGEVILLVEPYPAIEEIGRDYGKALATKPLIIDVSNPSAGRDGDAIVKFVADQGGAGLDQFSELAARFSHRRLGFGLDNGRLDFGFG